jgi:glucose/arabinose dehydrogenase
MSQFDSLRRQVRRRLPHILTFAAIAGCASSAKLPLSAGTGPNPTLPRPSKSRVPTVNVAKVVGWSGRDHPVAVPGTSVSAFARRLDHPRWLYVLPNGDVLVAEANAPLRPEFRTGIRAWFLRLFMNEGGSPDPSANRITLLRDADNDGIAETRSVFLKNLNSPFGMALVNGMLYVANTDAIVRFPYTNDQLEITASPTKIVNLPAGPINHHWTRGLIANAAGTKLYVSVGSNSDWGERGMENEVDRAAILEIDIARGSSRVFASGMRNPVGLAWVPETGALWTAVNEREELGGDIPPDYMTAVKEGGFYGWPYSYHGANIDERVKPQRPDLVDMALVPDYALGAHTSSMGLAYARNTSLPSRFNNGMIVTQRGSWNRIPRSGYRVVFVPFDNGKPNGQPILLLGGFLNGDENAQGRPVGVAIDKRGGVLIADDAGDMVWRITGSTPTVVASAATAPAPSVLDRFAAQVRAAEGRGAQAERDPSTRSSDRRCIDANTMPNAKSGDFTVAGFSMYASTWQQRQGRLVMKPSWPEARAPLVVRAQSLDDGAAPVEFRIPALSGSIADNSAAYQVTMQLPKKGNWLVTAEAGKNWGCFVYTLR